MVGPDLRVEVIPCLEDNYSYVLSAREQPDVVVIDPSEAQPVMRTLAHAEQSVAAIWLTHHHHDHIGGVSELLERWPHAEVLASRYDLEHDRIPRVTRPLDHGAALSFAGVEGRVLHLPAHTLGALTYVLDGHAFVGDTLFLCGAGRLREGDASMLLHALETLRGLPKATKLYCGHEYTLTNIRFAREVEPTNSTLTEYEHEAAASRAVGQPTVPATLGQQCAVNPFLRWDAPEVRTWAAHLLRRAVAELTDVEVVGALRSARNTFR